MVRCIVLGLVLKICVPIRPRGGIALWIAFAWRVLLCLVLLCCFVFLSDPWGGIALRIAVCGAFLSWSHLVVFWFLPGRRYWCTAHRLDMEHFIVLGLVFHFVLMSSSRAGSVLCIVFACPALLFLVSSCCFVLLSGPWEVVYCALHWHDAIYRSWPQCVVVYFDVILHLNISGHRAKHGFLNNPRSTAKHSQNLQMFRQMFEKEKTC